MRVLYSFPHPLGSPGVGVTAYNQARSLADQGVELELACTSLADEPPPARRVITTLALAGRRIPHRAVGLKRAYRHHDRVTAAALERLRGEIDLVHCWPRASIKTSRAGSRVGIPVLREAPHVHTRYLFERNAEETARLGMAPVKGHAHTADDARLRQEEREFELADYLLVPSEFSRQTFLERGLPAEKLVMHQYGFDPARFFPGGGAADPERPLQALFVGRCEPIKGVHYALEAWLSSGAAEHGRFVICGGFVPGYRELLAPLLSHPSVELRGFVANPADLMRESDVLVLPSIAEGSALVTYEAQACGCVLVVSDATGARCVHERHGLVHRAGDVGGLADHLGMLHRDRALLARLRKSTLEHARGLTWGHAAEQLREAYATCTTKTDVLDSAR